MTFTTTVSTATSGTLVIINNSQNVTVSMDISSSSASLCQTNAEWIVEDFGYELPNWGTVTFTDASAKTLSSTQVTPGDATINYWYKAVLSRFWRRRSYDWLVDGNTVSFKYAPALGGF